MLMVGIEHRIPFILERDLIAPANISTGVVTRSLAQTDKLAKEVAYVFIGRHEGIDEFVATRKAFWCLGLVEGAKFLITYEIADIPAVVGPPIMWSVSQEPAHNGFNVSKNARQRKSRISNNGSRGGHSPDANSGSSEIA